MVKPLIDSLEYPFPSNFFKVGDLNYHYLDEGSGDPIVMVHGNPTWSFYFRNAVKDLSSSFRTIVPDHIGCGLSDKPDSRIYRYTLDQRIDDLEELLVGLGITKNIILMVHDWGGMIGMGFAARNPSSISKLVITNTAAFHMPQGMRFPTVLKACRAPVIGPLMVKGLNAFSLGAARFCMTKKRMEPQIRKAYLGPYDSWNNRTAVYQFVKDIPLGPSDSCYSTVSMIEESLSSFRNIPTMICWGAKDFIFGDRFLTDWVQRFPQAQVHRFADAGHYLFEDAWPEVREKVLPFLMPTGKDERILH